MFPLPTAGSKDWAKAGNETRPASARAAMNVFMTGSLRWCVVVLCRVALSPGIAPGAERRPELPAAFQGFAVQLEPDVAVGVGRPAARRLDDDARAVGNRRERVLRAGATMELQLKGRSLGLRGDVSASHARIVGLRERRGGNKGGESHGGEDGLHDTSPYQSRPETLCGGYSRALVVLTGNTYVGIGTDR